MNSLLKAMESMLQSQFAGRRAPVPESGRLAWRWFLGLCRTRTSNGYGPNPISYAEIEAYARLYHWPLEPRHVDLILALDRVWLDQARHQQPDAGIIPRSSGQVMTPEAFDAVFA